MAGYANTYHGFVLALAHLRDLYAPNVLLGYHVSNWASLTDIGSSTESVAQRHRPGRRPWRRSPRRAE